MSIITTTQAVITALKSGSAVTDPHPALHVEERTAIAVLQQTVSDMQGVIDTLQSTVAALGLRVPALYSTPTAATTAGQQGQLAIGQFVEVG